MKEIIKLHSRGEVNNYLKKMLKPDGSECKTYALKTDIPYLRVGTVEGGKKFIDPSGGPMIVEGYMLEEAGAVVKHIDHAMGQGYLITFE